MGRFAQIGRGRWWTPLRAILSVAWVFLAFGVLSKSNCALGRPDDNGVLQLNWDGNRQLTSFCYNDIVPLYGARGLDQPGFVYDWTWEEEGVTRYMEYPVLAGMFQGLMGKIAHATYGIVDKLLPEVGWYFFLTALVMSILWVAAARMVAELAGNRIWDTILVVASPIVIVHAFTNWDIPTVFFLTAALLAARNKKFWLAGALIGLGTAFKMWPLFALGAYLVLAIRKKKFAPFLKMLASAVIVWLVVNVPIMMRNYDAWNEFRRLNTERGWEWTTIYAFWSRLTGWPGFPADVASGGEPKVLNMVSLALFAGACVAILVMGLVAERTPRVAELVFLIVAFFLLFNKVWSPQYSLWLVVPAVLALPNWRLIFTWGFFDMLVWPILMWHMLGVDNKGAPGELLNLAIALRDGFIIAIMVLVIMQMFGKKPDKVYDAHNGHDPLLTTPEQWLEVTRDNGWVPVTERTKEVNTRWEQQPSPESHPSSSDLDSSQRASSPSSSESPLPSQ
ncbi:glycosyltransferase family 87 protein [Corynebacterium aquatimens]|nr:glycosyltransferase 87 family protein [Corynebacterium aquatimens]